MVKDERGVKDEDVICLDCMWLGNWEDTEEYHCPICGSDQVVTIKALRRHE
jgi:predicted RNA-binding Zn-ribbon protein involved in translation (DUF1610 family)